MPSTQEMSLYLQQHLNQELLGTETPVGEAGRGSAAMRASSEAAVRDLHARGRTVAATLMVTNLFANVVQRAASMDAPRAGRAQPAPAVMDLTLEPEPLGWSVDALLSAGCGSV